MTLAMHGVKANGNEEKRKNEIHVIRRLQPYQFVLALFSDKMLPSRSVPCLNCIKLLRAPLKKETGLTLFSCAYAYG